MSVAGTVALLETHHRDLMRFLETIVRELDESATHEDTSERRYRLNRYKDALKAHKERAAEIQRTA